MRWGEMLRRLVLVPPTLFGVAVIVFVLLRVVPGDPIAMMIPPGARQADIDRLRALYGLDQPILRAVRRLARPGAAAAISARSISRAPERASSWCWRACRRRSNWRCSRR